MSEVTASFLTKLEARKENLIAEAEAWTLATRPKAAVISAQTTRSATTIHQRKEGVARPGRAQRDTIRPRLFERQDVPDHMRRARQRQRRGRAARADAHDAILEPAARGVIDRKTS